MNLLQCKQSVMTKLLAGLVLASCMIAPEVRAGAVPALLQSNPVVLHKSLSDSLLDNGSSVLVATLAIAAALYVGYQWWMTERSCISKLVRADQVKVDALLAEMKTKTDGSLRSSEACAKYEILCAEFDSRVLLTIRSQFFDAFPDELTKENYATFTRALNRFKDAALGFFKFSSRSSQNGAEKSASRVERKVKEFQEFIARAIGITEDRFYSLEFLLPALTEYADKLQKHVELEAEGYKFQSARVDAYDRKGSKSELTVADKEIQGWRAGTLGPDVHFFHSSSSSSSSSSSFSSWYSSSSSSSWSSSSSSSSSLSA